MIDQPHTPDIDDIIIAYHTYVTEDGTYSQEFEVSRDEFNRWLAAEIAAAKQRGAVKALRDVEASLIDWEVLYGHEEGTPEQHESIRIAAWVGRRADQIEGVE